MVGIQILGLDKLKRATKKSTITKPLNDGIKKITFTLEGMVKKATVVGVSGRLRASIQSSVTATQGQVGTWVDYSDPVEYGHQRGATFIPARHMEGSAKILGQGMFSYGLEELEKKMGSQLKEMGVEIGKRFGK